MNVGELFNLHQKMAFIGADEGPSVAFSAGPGGSSDAVYVVVWVVGDVVVHHVGDAVNINASGSEI
ncbi:MAG: hypothetical protein CBD11_05770 [Phycisphaera sp. TMED151]|nr:MAG: hypothetical protein CBD11_05770 [Phycisphaera sp. TMED151]